MGVLELLEKNRTQARERRMALIAAEDAATTMKRENSPPHAIEPEHGSLRHIKPTYSGLKSAKRRKINGKLILRNGCPSIAG